jgi:hypothetical protein
MVLMWIAGRFDGMVRETFAESEEINETTLGVAELVKLVKEGKKDSLQQRHFELIDALKDALGVRADMENENSPGTMNKMLVGASKTSATI